MHLRTRARDCLYLNWALPHDAAPELASPLRYELHRHDDADWVFASLLIFRLDGLHLTRLPGVRLSYPQANLRLYVLDGDDVPSVLFLRTWVPPWIMPAVRVVGQQPARAAWLSVPPPSEREPADVFRWRVRRLGGLDLRGRLDAPAVGPGPRIGSWEQTVAHFRERPRGYVQHDAAVRAVTTAHPAVTVWPLKVEVRGAGLLESALPAVPTATWHAPHSAWLCPEIPFRFELGKLGARALARSGLPAAEGV